LAVEDTSVHGNPLFPLRLSPISPKLDVFRHAGLIPDYLSISAGLIG
jgi:hypothetical protein